MRNWIRLWGCAIVVFTLALRVDASNITYHNNVAFDDFPLDLQTNASLHDWEDGFLDVTMAPFAADNTCGKRAQI